MVADTLEASCRFKRVASQTIFLSEKVIFLEAGRNSEKKIDIDMASGHFHYIVRHGDIDAFSHGKLVVSKEVIQAAIREQILTLNTCPSVCTGVYTAICKHVSATYMKHKYKCEKCGSPKTLSFVPLIIKADEEGDCYGKSYADEPHCVVCNVSKYYPLSRVA